MERTCVASQNRPELVADAWQLEVRQIAAFASSGNAARILQKLEASLSDADINTAVQYMITQAK